jgi:hypothetical protein
MFIFRNFSEYLGSYDINQWIDGDVNMMLQL